MILNELYKLNELSPDTLSSYKKAAGADATAADAAGDYARGNKRFKGIVKATKKQFANDTKGVTEDDDAVAAFLSRGGEIQQLKPQRGPKRSGVSFASKHIGSASGRGNTKGKVSGLGANTGKSGKPVVTAEQGVAEGQMSDLDIEYQDYKTVSPREFYNMYKMTKQAWFAKYKNMLPQQGVAEKLGDNRPKLGSSRDRGKSVRKWRKARGLDESGMAEASNELATMTTMGMGDPLDFSSDYALYIVQKGRELYSTMRKLYAKADALPPAERSRFYQRLDSLAYEGLGDEILRYSKTLTVDDLVAITDVLENYDVMFNTIAIPDELQDAEAAWKQYAAEVALARTQPRPGQTMHERSMAEGQVNELSGDLLRRAALVAKNKSDKAMDPKIHDALGGGYMNPLAKHYNTVSDKFSNKAAKVGQRDAAKNIASPAVMRKIGMAEGSNNSKTIITEALIAQKLWENAGRKLMEAQLTADQITQIFQQIQQDATAAGGNRTLIGKGKDAADAVGSAWTNLKDKIYNSKPMSGFAAQYDKAAEKLKQATGGDAGAMKYIQKYRDFATKHPMLQSAIYAALIAASGISGVGLAGAAALGLFKLVDQAIQGKDIRSAMWSGVKTGATAYAAGQIGQALKGQPSDVSGFDITQGLSPEQIKTLKDLGASGQKMVIQGGELWYEGPNGLVMFTTPDGSSAEAMLKVAQGAGSQAGQAVSNISGYDKIETGKFGDFGQPTYNLQPLQDMASNPNLSPVAQKLAADLAAGKNVSGAGEYLRKAMAAAAQRSSIMGDMPDGSANAGMRTFMSLQNLQKAIDDAGLAATLKESVTLSESQIFFVIGKIVERHRKLDEGIMNTIKGAAGKAVGSVVNYAKTKGTNLTTKITADKLLQAWKKAGSPMDSATVAKVIQDAGVPAASVQQAYSTMKIPFDAAPAAPAAPASGPGDPTPLLSPAQLAAKRDPAAAPAATPAPAKTPDYSKQSTGYSGGTYTIKQPAAPAAQPGIPSTGTSNSVFGRTSTSSTGGISQPTATGLRHTAKANNPNQPAAAPAAPTKPGFLQTATDKIAAKKTVAPQPAVAEGAMPAAVIRIKEKIRQMSDAEKKEYFQGKTREQLQQMARRHGYGENSNVYAKYAAQGLNEFAPGGGGDDDIGDDPYKYPDPKPYGRSINFFGQFEADHFDKEDMNDATGEFRGYWNYDGKPKLIAYFKFNNPAKTDSDDPGMGWYYEPQNEGVAEGLNEFAMDDSNDDSNDGFSDDTLRQLAAQWYNGDEDPKVEQTLAAAGWEIGQDEGYDDTPGVFVVRAGDINGRSYMSWPAPELEGLAEATGDEKFDKSMRQMTGKITPGDAAEMFPTQEFEPLNLDPSYLPMMDKYKAKLFPLAYEFWTEGTNADELRALGWEPDYGDDYVMVILSGIGHDGHIQYDKYDFDAEGEDEDLAESQLQSILKSAGLPIRAIHEAAPRSNQIWTGNKPAATLPTTTAAAAAPKKPGLLTPNKSKEAAYAAANKAKAAAPAPAAAVPVAAPVAAPAAPVAAKEPTPDSPTARYNGKTGELTAYGAELAAKEKADRQAAYAAAEANKAKAAAAAAPVTAPAAPTTTGMFQPRTTSPATNPAGKKVDIVQTANTAMAAGGNPEAAAIAAMKAKNPKLAAMMAQAGLDDQGNDIAAAPVAEDSLASMKRLAGIASVSPYNKLVN